MSHISVLLHETVDALLADRNTGIYVDGTFGRGGHTRLLLSKLDENARVYGFDKDPQALETAAILEQEDSRFKIIHASFADLKQELEARGIGLVDGVMADLGVSSPQLDQAERGFSFMKDGPLDMRMDNSKGPTAAEWLVNIEEEALANVIFKYGEERYSRRIAKAIKAAGYIETTAQLAEIVKVAHPKWEKNKHAATRTFQGIRIAINKELEDIEAFLPQAVDVLKTGGRLAVISFHSLEDRLIKQFIQKESTLAEDTSWGMPQEREDTRRLKKISRVRASEEEIKANFRSRSAWLRVAERLASKGE
ncbi:16S rRNA (cytosine(1402)-N(4))-methyltransferase RsmH [Acinetobacter sp. ANC 5380]|jgi:16S rRNA (cytosine1402-N4)-methyltransferase|uniref:Ribosomal RNA small subunit methyltransferase H n=1 Tax=Acinetobacter terrae TaxID=2731247 RepID=A0A4R0EPA5_9GAMM|nr:MULTISPECIES: 16S rRNA (cytosine(1402)-N(4))-methyltransferase RsmH [Acinetobacter Taxon 24]NNG77430.1 16S rRNA (cytosine(1402)-N(4))-methyltransferase RsmH [Acinetobacter terrae]NNG81114.1 16S rRNA (cytosine(1402)-N(4))-methyltransferase RsmH [Acinetobacter sp. ANC 5378]NNH14851.1 16S rRNA (cytosine(1402)-N(4))-methyltransferase RsmH [Acinetobacter terrae]NNH38107.1 16S rRNA (cytosine(1402)-N(4))-methyltransferase RsmH [Acinetobacter terrae]NNH77325.1 16S rRNA (cytosine(1402)-N(4))-methylt